MIADNNANMMRLKVVIVEAELPTNIPLTRSQFPS